MEKKILAADIAKDYFMAFRWGNVYKEVFSNFGVVFCMVNPLIQYMIIYKGAQELWFNFLAVYLPFVFIMVSVSLHPVKLHKMMYLCPVSAEGRMTCVRKAYCFRIAVQMSVVSIGMAVLLPAFEGSVLALVAIFLNDLVLSILITAVERTDDKAEDNGREFAQEEVYKALMTGIAVLVIFLQMMMICEPEPDMTGDLIILGMTVFVQIPLMIRYRKYVREALAAAAYYETAG